MLHDQVLTSILGFAGNDSPSFVFPTAIATKGPAGGAGGSGSGRPAVANKPSFLTGGAGPGGHLSAKRGTEDLDFFIGDEAIAASGGPGRQTYSPANIGIRLTEIRIWPSLSHPTWPNRKLGMMTVKIGNDLEQAGLTASRITWRDSGQTPSSNTCELSLRTITFYLLNL